MSHADQALREALVHGTAQAHPDMEATWRQVNRRVAAGRLRTRILRTAAAAVAAMALTTAAVPSLRAAAADVWTEVLQMTQSTASYVVALNQAPTELPTLQPDLQATDGPITISPSDTRTTTVDAPAGKLPALTDLLPIRTPSPLPQVPGKVTTTIHAGDGALQGMQLVRMTWEDGTMVEQYTALARPSATAAWTVADAPRQMIMSTLPGGAVPEEVKLTDTLSALRSVANGHVFYHFSWQGTDFSLSAPAAQEETLVQMAQSLVR